MTLVFTLGARNNHLAILENECCGSRGIFEAHDQRSKTSRIILGIAAMVADCLQVEFGVKIGSRHQVLDARRLVLRHLLVAISVGSRRGDP